MEKEGKPRNKKYDKEYNEIKEWLKANGFDSQEIKQYFETIRGVLPQ